MYFLFSGEGALDLGVSREGVPFCGGDAYLHGPMTVIVDQIVSSKMRFSLLETSHYGFLSEAELSRLASKLRPARKSPRLPGKKRARETMYFHRNARAFARYARRRGKQIDDKVVAVLFRDCDGTASAGRGLWSDKRQSMVDGFVTEKLKTGVPMIPKPKSEAWLLCALKNNPYAECEKLEDRSGNDASPNSLKTELEERIGSTLSREALRNLVEERTVDVDLIDMPSFAAFRDRLEEVI